MNSGGTEPTINYQPADHHRPELQPVRSLRESVRDYWNRSVHDEHVSSNPVGSRAWFRDLEEYHFDKQRHLLTMMPFDRFQGRDVLDVGCGIGIDLARFARGGANAVGVDLSRNAIDLATKNFEQQGLEGDFAVMDAERLKFRNDSFDLVYAYDTLHYAADPRAIVREIYRVLRPDGVAILQSYNRHSWLWWMSKFAKVDLEHSDAPVYRPYIPSEFDDLVSIFPHRIVFTERFPVRSRLHSGGLNGVLYNEVMVRGFDLLPRRLVRNIGWHVIAFASKRYPVPLDPGQRLIRIHEKADSGDLASD